MVFKRRSKAPLRWKPPVFAEQLAQTAHVWCGLSQDREQFMHRMEVAYNHDHQCL